MSWRVVVVASNAKIDYKMDYLVVRNVDSAHRIHISEIAVLMLESTAISITAYALCELLANKVKVIFCDRQRNPCGELIPMSGSHDSSAKIRQQISWTPHNKQLVWTELVSEKIRRQRSLLIAANLSQSELLTKYIEQMQLNDATNREGHAAKVYFNALFGCEFSRANNSIINAALNYGYSIILSAINREISAAGYLTQIGIFHDNTYNPYNLGCDFMEPIRPLVDYAVIKLEPEEFEKKEKLALVDLVNAEVSLEGKQYHLINALRLYCSSLFRALQSGDISEIKFISYEL